MPNIVKALQRDAEGFLQEVPLGQPQISNPTYAPILTLDASICDVLRVTLTGDLVVNLVDSGMDGQKLMMEITQDVVGHHNVSLGTGVSWGKDVTSYNHSGDPGSTDVIGLLRHAPTSTWRVVAVAKGF